MPFFIKKVRVELWDTYLCQASDAGEVEARLNDDRRETYLGSATGVADGEILVFGPFTTAEEALAHEAAWVESPIGLVITVNGEQNRWTTASPA